MTATAEAATTVDLDAERHPFTRDPQASAWTCQCGRSRNSSTHKGEGSGPRVTRESKAPTPAGTVAACKVEAGVRVLTTDVIGTDFGLDLVAPTRRRGGFERVVRSRLREAGGIVVRFTDGCKTRPMNGNTVFHLAALPQDTDQAAEVQA